MSKCKKAAKSAGALAGVGTNVTVSVNVTNIVKYVSLAGVAIVGIIFGTRCYVQCVKAQKTSSGE